MTILKRTKNIIAAKVQICKSTYIDPESDIEEILISMDSAVKDLEKSLAATLMMKKMSERQIEEMEGEQANWLENAKRAVGAGQDDLARRALLQKKSIAEDISNIREQLTRTDESYTYLKNELKRNKEKYQELKSKINLVKHNNLMNKLGMGNRGNREEEEHILELKFENLRKSSKSGIGIDDEIENLKSKLKK